MAYISQDPNQKQDNNTTNVLAPNAAPTPQAPQNDAPAQVTTSGSTSASTGGYVSDGNPYGKYATPTGPQAPGGTSASSRKSSSGASSGLQTNVQTYAQKNQASSQGLGSAVANKLQTSSDLAKQNLAKVEQKFGQGVESGSLANRQNAVTDVRTAATEAATATGPERTFKDTSASLYMPTKTTEGTYSAEDQALVSSNKARVKYADGSVKDFEDAATAQKEIDSTNKANPGYYTYGDEAKLSVDNDRLSEILNAKYKGPQELSQIAGFGEASNKIQDVSALQQQALGGSPKEELLKRTFDNQTGEYSKGARLLDDLLLGQGKAAETLKTTAEKLGSAPSGKIADEFTSRIKEARGQASQRGTEIDTIKDEARKALTETAAGRDKEVNQRIEGVIKDWEKYPQYFKDRFKSELESHNVASKKKQEFDAIASKYGGAEQAKTKLASIKTTMPNIDTFDFDSAIKDAGIVSTYDKALKTAQLQPNGGGRERKLLEQNIAEAQSIVKQYSGSIDSLRQKTNADNQILNNVSPDFMNSYNTLASQIGGGGNDRDKRTYQDQLGQLVQQAKNSTSTAKAESLALQQDLPKIEQLSEFASYDPNALDLKLSQLEAESLGVQGGEGLYNILKEQGVDGLIKTAAYDKNKLVSTDEQSQLARLQSMAQLAKDYGVSGSGINVNNRYSDRDLAGQQNATSALDIDNFRNLLQGAERTFRTDAAGSNITGTGTGSGSSRGLFGKKKATVTQSVTQNFGDLLKQNNAYRNMYSDEGVNKDLLRRAASAAKGDKSFESGNVDPGVVGGLQDAAGDISGTLGGLLSKNSPLGSDGARLAMLPITAPLELAKFLGSSLGGSSSAARGKATAAAAGAAGADLQNKINQKVLSTGLKNQLSVKQNNQQDMELFKLLGLLDNTNL